MKTWKGVEVTTCDTCGKEIAVGKGARCILCRKDCCEDCFAVIQKGLFGYNRFIVCRSHLPKEIGDMLTEGG